MGNLSSFFSQKVPTETPFIFKGACVKPPSNTVHGIKPGATSDSLIYKQDRQAGTRQPKPQSKRRPKSKSKWQSKPKVKQQVESIGHTRARDDTVDAIAEWRAAKKAKIAGLRVTTPAYNYVCQK